MYVAMTPIPFAIVGTGWRAEFYLRVARACPEHFKVVGLVSRGNPAIEARFGVKTYPSLPLRATSLQNRKSRQNNHTDLGKKLRKTLSITCKKQFNNI
jgi:hypothetical protein